MGAKQRHQRMTTLQHIPDGTERVLIASGRYLGEGFDDVRLDTLFLTMPRLARTIPGLCFALDFCGMTGTMPRWRHRARLTLLS